MIEGGVRTIERVGMEKIVGSKEGVQPPLTSTSVVIRGLFLLVEGSQNQYDG